MNEELSIKKIVVLGLMAGAIYTLGFIGSALGTRAILLKRQG
jgi:hypothetical protein